MLLGSSAGFIAGLLGIGGGVILVPLLLWVFGVAGMSQGVIAHAAFGTSLAIIIPTAFSSTLGHRKRGNVEWHQVFWLSLGGAGGAVAGASLAVLLPGELLKALFGIMQILVALKLFFFHPHMPPERREGMSLSALVLVGAAGGAFAAFFGVGGGVIAVPLMVLVLQLPIHLAVGNSSALIVISSLFGTLSYVYHGWGAAGLAPFSLGYVNVLAAAIIVPFTMTFARLGVRVAGGISHDRLVKVFALVLILVGVRMAFRAFVG